MYSPFAYRNKWRASCNQGFFINYEENLQEDTILFQCIDFFFTLVWNSTTRVIILIWCVVCPKRLETRNSFYFVNSNMKCCVVLTPPRTPCTHLGKKYFAGSFQVKCPHRSCKDSSGSFPVTSLMVHSVRISFKNVSGSLRSLWKPYQNLRTWRHELTMWHIQIRRWHSGRVYSNMCLWWM